MIRDSEGRMIASLVEKIPLAQIVANVEAAVARRTILFAKDLNLSSIILEGDSEIITRALQAEDQSLASYGNIIEEIKFHANSFSNFRVSHVKRKGNSVAHNLVRHVSGLDGGGSFPHFTCTFS